MSDQRLWWRRISDTETHKQWCSYRPGPEWYELPRELESGEIVQIVDGRAEIIPAPVIEPSDPRRERIAAALPDILLAVADGADLAEEVRKIVGKE